MLRWAYKPKFIVSNNECFLYQSRPRIEHLAITSKMMVVIFHVGSNKIVTHQESYVSIAWILQYTQTHKYTRRQISITTSDKWRKSVSEESVRGLEKKRRISFVDFVLMPPIRPLAIIM